MVNRRAGQVNYISFVQRTTYCVVKLPVETEYNGRGDNEARRELNMAAADDLAVKLEVGIQCKKSTDKQD